MDVQKTTIRDIFKNDEYSKLYYHTLGSLHPISWYKEFLFRPLTVEFVNEICLLISHVQHPFTDKLIDEIKKRTPTTISLFAHCEKDVNNYMLYLISFFERRGLTHFYDSTVPQHVYDEIINRDIHTAFTVILRYNAYNMFGFETKHVEFSSEENLDPAIRDETIEMFCSGKLVSILNFELMAKMMDE
jgi:hypothetical protein